MEAFAHEGLVAYGVAKEFFALAVEIIRRMPGGDAAEQLDAAASSSMQNIAEGAGRRPGRDKARFFDYARASAAECASILDRLEIRGWIEPQAAAKGRALLHREVRLLSGLARSALARAARPA